MTNNKSNSRTLDRFSRALLAGTCLAAAGGTASAGIIVEGTAPAPSDFGNTFGTRYLLPSGTTEVQGSAPAGDIDWFQFGNLTAGTSFSLSYGSGEYSLNVFDTSLTQLASVYGVEDGTGALTGTVPLDGNLVVKATDEFEFPQYDLVLTAQQGSAAPEPATLALTGLALGGALAWRRKRRETQQ